MNEESLSLTTWIKTAVSCLEKKEFIPFKTSILKILYLALPGDYRRKLYEPYLYGPYSERVSSLLNSLAFDYHSLHANLCQLPNGRLATVFSVDENLPIDQEAAKRIFAAIEVLARNEKRSATDISAVCKVHYLKSAYCTDDPEVLAREARLIGWDLPPKKVAELVEVAVQISTAVSD